MGHQILPTGFKVLMFQERRTAGQPGRFVPIDERYPVSALRIQTGQAQWTRQDLVTWSRQRGKRNEPAYTAMTAAVLAETRGVSEEEIARQTTENFFRLFSKVPRQNLQTKAIAS